MENIMEAANEDFKYTFRATLKNLESHLLKIRNFTYRDAHKHMAKQGLDVPTILKDAKAQYRRMFDAGKWPAASHAKDSKAMSKNYGTVNMMNQSDLQKVANALVKQMQQTDPKKGKPFKGKDGKKNKQFNSSDKSKRNNPKRNGKEKNPALTTPPKRGESEIKFIDGTKRYWCGKCGRWTLSHTEDGHKTKEELEAERSGNKTAGMARVGFELHPAAFMAYADPTHDVKSPGNYWLNKGIILVILMSFILHFSIASNYNAVFEASSIAWNHGLELWNSTRDYLIMFAEFVYPIMMNLLTATQLEFMNTSWIIMIAIIMSGITGFGTAAYVYKHIPDEQTPHVRYRHGINYRKKFARAHKKMRNMRRVPRTPTARIKPEQFSTRFVHHQKFSHIGRHKIRELP